MWPAQEGWYSVGFRQTRVFFYLALGRLIGGPNLGRIPFNWVSSVADIQPNPVLDSRVKNMTPGSPTCTMYFPAAPAGFESFARKVTLAPTTNFVATDALVSPRTGAVWFENGPILGESCGSMYEFFSWSYAAHDLLANRRRPAVRSDHPVLCVPSSGYFHLMLESLPAFLRLLESGERCDLLLWSDAPRYVRDVAELLQGAGAGRSHHASGPVRAHEVLIAGRRQLSGHFDPEDLARLRSLADRVTTSGQLDAGRDCIFVTRAGAHRALANEQDVAAFLGDRGFVVADPGRHTIRDQMAMFQRARLVVGAHGGGLTNIAFCPPGTAVLEILRPDRIQDCYARLAHLSGLDYLPQLTDAQGRVSLAQLAAGLQWATDRVTRQHPRAELRRSADGPDAV